MLTCVVELSARIYRSFERDRPQLKPGRYYEVRIGSLIERPWETLAQLDDHLQRGEFTAVRPPGAGLFGLHQRLQAEPSSSERYAARQDCRKVVRLPERGKNQCGRSRQDCSGSLEDFGTQK